MTGWVDQIDSSKVSVLPPALMGVLLAYAKWQNQQYAVKYGGFTALIIVPFVAVRAIPIENFPTFALVLFCIVVAGASVAVKLPDIRTPYAGVVPRLFARTNGTWYHTTGVHRSRRSVLESFLLLTLVFLGLFAGALSLSLGLFVWDSPRRSRSDWAKIFFLGSFLFLVVPWLMLETLGTAETPRQVALVFLGLFAGALSLSLGLFVWDNLLGTLVFGVSFLIVILMLLGVWWVITLFGLEKSHPAIAEAIVYAALMGATGLLIVCLVMKGKVSRRLSKPPDSN